MKHHRIVSALAATTTSVATALLCAAAAGFSDPARADGVFNAAGRGSGIGQGSFAGRSAFNAQGDRGTAAGQRRVAGDGEGNVNAVAGGGFNTAAGGQGLRTRSFNRNADGSASAHNQASATTANGSSASAQSSFTRNADDSANGERSTTGTNANTGVTYDGSTSYAKGSGFNRSASCTDAAGHTVSCGAR